MCGVNTHGFQRVPRSPVFGHGCVGSVLGFAEKAVSSVASGRNEWTCVQNARDVGESTRFEIQSHKFSGIAHGILRPCDDGEWLRDSPSNPTKRSPISYIW